MAKVAPFEALREEIDRVLASPYPTQLRRLHTIVCYECSSEDLARWASAKPCQIRALARNILEARSHWPYILELMISLSEVKEIRDALLFEDSSLLHEIVSCALNGKSEALGYTAAAVAMLSHPLPNDIALPAASQTLFLAAIDHASQAPSEKTIKPIYKLLRGTMAPLIGLLSSERLQTLETQLLNIVRNARTAESNCFTIYTLATMKRIIDASEASSPACPSSFYATQELLANTPASPRLPRALLQFFTGNKASKTLQLIVLRVLWACGAKSEGTDTEIMDTLLLANELVTKIPDSIRDSWCCENMVVIRKLQDKMGQLDLPQSILFHTSTFLCRLNGPKSLAGPAKDRLHSLFSKPVMMVATLHDPSAADFDIILKSLGPDSMYDSISALPNVLLEADMTNLGISTQTISSFIESLAGTFSGNTHFAARAFDAFTSAAFFQKLERIKELIDPALNLLSFEHNGICAASLRHTQRHIVRVICEFGLKVIMLGQHATAGLHSKLATLLIATHASSAANLRKCHHSTEHRLTKNELHNLVESTGDIVERSTDWRDGLRNHLERSVKSEHNKLIALFTKACKDLENRCENVEAPLKEERARRTSIENQHDALSRAFVELQEGKAQFTLRFDEMKNEHEQCIQQRDATQAYNESLLSRIEILEETLRKSKTEAEEQMASMKRLHELSELEYSAASAQKEEQIDELGSRIAIADEQVKEHEVYRSETERSLAQYQSENESLKTDVERLQTIAAEQGLTFDALSTEKSEFMALNEALQSRADSLEHQLILQARVHEDTIAKTAQDALVASNIKIRDLQKEHEETAQAAEQKLQSCVLQYEHDLAMLRSTHDAVLTQLSKRERDVDAALKKIDKFKSICGEKDAEILRLNAIRDNMMAAMGMTTVSTVGRGRSRRTTQVPLRSTQESFVEDPFSEDLTVNVDAAQDALDDQRAHSDGQINPSHKRARSRKSLRITSPPKRRSTLMPQCTGHALPPRASTKRMPLVPISGNKSPPKEPSAEMFIGYSKSAQTGLADLTFDESDLFDTTSGARASQVTDLPDDTTIL